MSDNGCRAAVDRPDRDRSRGHRPAGGHRVHGVPAGAGKAQSGQLINVVSLEIADGAVRTVRSGINPDKLAHLIRSPISRSCRLSGGPGGAEPGGKAADRRTGMALRNGHSDTSPTHWVVSMTGGSPVAGHGTASRRRTTHT